MLHKFALIAALVFTAATSFAHSVWIEPDGDGQLVVRFAEPGDDFETSPGYLDNLSTPLAFVVASNAPQSIETLKRSDYFLLSTASSTNTTCLETSFTVRGGRKPIFYARWQSLVESAPSPFLTLDLVPIGKPGEVRAYFRGKPLANIKATLHIPDNGEAELTSDADGFLRFEANQKGQYLLTISHHREPLAGFHGGIGYKETSHNCSLAWQQ